MSEGPNHNRENTDENCEEQAKESRPWKPKTERKVRSKKAFDQQKVSALVDEERPGYKGQLDPRNPKAIKRSKPRSISRREERVLRKAKALSEENAAPGPKRKNFTDFRAEFHPSKASPARLGALYATAEVRKRSGFAQEIIENTIDRSKLSESDKAFATLLTLGVVSTSGALDEIINGCINSPSDLKPDVRDALRISTYELIYLRKAPHAALDQGVELVRAVAPSAARFGNAVLHRVLKASESFPFGDPSKSLDTLALLYGFPLWLCRLLVEDLGSQEAIAFMKASNEPAPLFVAINAIKGTDSSILETLEACGASMAPGVAGGFKPVGCYEVSPSRILKDGRVRHLFAEGKLLVSDAAAQAVANLVLQEGQPEDLLEIGAGRGTKTLLLQSDSFRIFGNQTNLCTLDNHGFKTELLKERAETYGVKIREAYTGNALRLSRVIGDQKFSRIFVDAPCSGLGTLRRHHEIRWRLTPEQISELASNNLAMLKAAAGAVAPKGQLIYATCTVTYAENNGVVKAFLDSEEGKDFSLAPMDGKACFSSRLTPGSPDAHFAAKFQRRA